LLRIDDVVSGLRKKNRDGGAGEVENMSPEDDE
jgi:hypothetical protein